MTQYSTLGSLLGAVFKVGADDVFIDPFEMLPTAVFAFELFFNRLHGVGQVFAVVQLVVDVALQFHEVVFHLGDDRFAGDGPVTGHDHFGVEVLHFPERMDPRFDVAVSQKRNDTVEHQPAGDDDPPLTGRRVSTGKPGPSIRDARTQARHKTSGPGPVRLVHGQTHRSLE